MSSDQNMTQVLVALTNGDSSAAATLFPLIYDELHALAARLMPHERRHHTLQATALVHEAYLRMVDQT